MKKHIVLKFELIFSFRKKRAPDHSIYLLGLTA